MNDARFEADPELDETGVDETGVDEPILEIVSQAALQAYIANNGHVNAWPLARAIVKALRREGYV